MTDIVDELRARALQGRFNLDAASEIRKLRTELAEKNAAIIQINNICLRVEQECDALRAELSEQCRLLDMSTERKAKHLAEIAALEKERDALRAELAGLRSSMEFRTSLIGRTEAERDALRAKIEAMERQEPVGVLHVGNYYGEELQDWEFEANQCACDKLNEVYVSNPTSLPLYALHGAQPAPSLASNDVSLISEGKTQPAQSVKDVIIDDLQSQFDTEGITEHDSGDALIRLSDAIAAVEDNFTQPAPSVPEDVMRDAERYRYLRARDDETAGIGCWIEAEGRACDRGWLYGVQLDSAIDTCIEMLAVAPEAKP